MQKIRVLDFVILFIIMAAAVFMTVKNISQKGNKIIVHALGKDYEYSSETDGTYSVEGLIGTTTFQVKGGKVRIIDSPCANRLCINQGWASPLVCLPNEVIITLENQGEFDAVSE
ncbi:MAG: NusG domain II-containing protein [Treponema sp.]